MRIQRWATEWNRKRREWNIFLFLERKVNFFCQLQYIHAFQLEVEVQNQSSGACMNSHLSERSLWVTDLWLNICKSVKSSNVILRFHVKHKSTHKNHADVCIRIHVKGDVYVASDVNASPVRTCMLITFLLIYSPVFLSICCLALDLSRCFTVHVLISYLISKRRLEVRIDDTCSLQI